MSILTAENEKLDDIFAALAEPHRRRILQALAGGEKSVEALAQPMGASTWSTLKHVRVLEQTGLIVSEKIGRRRLCRLQPDCLEEAVKWTSDLRSFWASNLRRLETHLMKDD